MTKNIAKLLVLGFLYLLAVSWNESVTAGSGPYTFGTRMLAMPQGPVTELWFRINEAAEVAEGGQICSATVTNDCVKWVDFWTYDALGVKVPLTRVRWDSWRAVNPPAPDPCSTGCLEAVASPPPVSGRYKRDVQVYATAVAVEADGTTEVEAPPLGSSFGKRPRAGVAFGVR